MGKGRETCGAAAVRADRQTDRQTAVCLPLKGFTYSPPRPTPSLRWRQSLGPQKAGEFTEGGGERRGLCRPTPDPIFPRSSDVAKDFPPLD